MSECWTQWQSDKNLKQAESTAVNSVPLHLTSIMAMWDPVAVK